MSQCVECHQPLTENNDGWLVWGLNCVAEYFCDDCFDHLAGWHEWIRKCPACFEWHYLTLCPMCGAQPRQDGEAVLENVMTWPRRKYLLKRKVARFFRWLTGKEGY